MADRAGKQRQVFKKYLKLILTDCPLPQPGQVLGGSEGVEGGGAEERSEDLETSSQPGACRGRRECCRRGEVGKLFAFTDFREFAYF